MSSPQWLDGSGPHYTQVTHWPTAWEFIGVKAPVLLLCILWLHTCSVCLHLPCAWETQPHSSSTYVVHMERSQNGESQLTGTLAVIQRRTGISGGKKSQFLTLGRHMHVRFGDIKAPLVCQRSQKKIVRTVSCEGSWHGLNMFSVGFFLFELQQPLYYDELLTAEYK